MIDVLEIKDKKACDYKKFYGLEEPEF